MAHYAETGDQFVHQDLGESREVSRVIVIGNDVEGDGSVEEQEQRVRAFIVSTLRLGGAWFKTSYNATIRVRYAGPGCIYSVSRDAFIPPKPANATGFDEETCNWTV
jgi:hypothetical protein